MSNMIVQLLQQQEEFVCTSLSVHLVLTLISKGDVGGTLAFSVKSTLYLKDGREAHQNR